MDTQGMIVYIVVTIILVCFYAFILNLVHKRFKKYAKEHPEEEQVLKDVFEVEEDSFVVKNEPVVKPQEILHHEHYVEDIVDEEKFSFHSSIEALKRKSAIEERSLRISLPSTDEITSEEFRKKKEVTKKVKSRPSDYIFELGKKNPKAAFMISYEIMSQPVTMRKTRALWQK